MARITAAIQEAWRRGLLFSFGVMFNRLIPARLFRFRVFGVYELGLPRSEYRDATNPENMRLAVRRCDSPQDRERAMRVSETTLAETMSEGNSSAGTDSNAGNHVAWIAQRAGDDMIPAEPIAGLWLASGAFDESELGARLLLPVGICWLFSAHVVSDVRRQGVYGTFLSAVLSDSSHTDQRFLAAINPTNVASMAAHRKFIRGKVCTCIALRLFGVALCIAMRGNREASDLKVSPKMACSLCCSAQPIEIQLIANR